MLASDGMKGKSPRVLMESTKMVGQAPSAKAGKRQRTGREEARSAVHIGTKLTLPTQPITQEGSVLRSCSTTPDGEHVPSRAAVLRTCALSVTRINASYQWLSVPLVTEEQSHLS